MPYKLSATLTAHSSDVRAVASPTNELVLSASRDASAISWQRTSNSSFTQSAVLTAGDRYVNSIAYLPPTAEAPQGYVVTGSQDAIINVFILGSPSAEPEYSLLGHKENVCALNTGSDGTIISGSWDKTAKVWKNFKEVYELKGHAYSVWAVVVVDPQTFLTASADKTIKLWQQHKIVRNYDGHKDAVRGLALVPDIGFASCSNDSEIRVWTLEGDVIFTMSGHTSFIYSLSVLPNGDIVSCGEDRSVRIWRDGECSQTVVLPAISVWTVSSMPNGDIVSGSSDGVVRIFSPSEERWASAEDLKAYDMELANQAVPAAQVGDVKKTDLPGLEALAEPGKKPGEVKMVRNEDRVEAHQWDSATSSWQKIGDVVDAVGSGRKQLYQGKEYDYVFDVDIQDGVPPLKLPYNVTENPYAAAQRFLQTNEISLNYIDEVVKFIEKNTGGVNLGVGGNEFVDPYTGATRYTGTGGSSANAPQQSYGDPYTGASRYTGTGGSPASAPQQSYGDPYTGASRYSGSPAPAPTPPTSQSSFSDPFTGASRYSGAASIPTPAPAATPPAASSPAILPARTPVTFKQANVPAMQSKLYQLDEALGNEISTSPLVMSPEELRLVDETFTYLSQAIAQPAGRSNTNKLSPAHVEAIMAILSRWPTSQRFPVMDLSRLVVGLAPEVLSTPGLKVRFFEALIQGADWAEPWSPPLPKPRETNVLLLLRAMANSLQDGTLIGDGSWVNLILESLGQVPYEAFTKSQRVVLASVLFNFSCVCLREAVNPNLRSLHFSSVIRVLQGEKTDSETVYRTLVALGNAVRPSSLPCSFGFESLHLS
ncbi:hypothetical protein JAAARDRAFT_573658 [Jaapia argillacea MUCL 33604]|uniref:Phospholipase A-2-activating protein n=1 Tax=Jaapia argillacea MUCL 33604 TaxID=933084 RepID=A0A067Q250_9AGAM|nr:hypothetical protein JAAARDRAFT_573658 [Jaapia argillacea MUCL 33604]